MKFDVSSENGERKTRCITFHGGKREAQKKLTELLDQVNKGSFIDPSKTTVAEFLDRWESWAATQCRRRRWSATRTFSHTMSALTFGGRPVQKLRTVDFEDLYGKLQSPKLEGASLDRPGGQDRGRRCPDRLITPNAINRWPRERFQHELPAIQRQAGRKRG